MQIDTNVVKIKNTKKFSSEYIENFFEKHNINPIRWAITKMEDDYFYVNVSYWVE